MKQLKMQSLKSNLAIILIFVLIGGGMLFFALPSVFIAAQDPIPLEEVDFDGDIEGLYVSGNLEFVYDWYCETTEGTKTVSREYIIDGGDYYYMGMKVMKKDMSPAEELLEASYDFMDGYADWSTVEAAQYEVKGTITKMPSDSFGYFKDYFEWDTMSAEDRATLLPYYLDVNKAGSTDITGGIVLSLLGLVFILIAVILIVRSMTGKYQKAVLKYINNSPSPDMARERVENFINSTPEDNKLRYNRDFICGCMGGTTAFGETSKLVWAYMVTTTHKRNFITVGKTYSIVLAFADGTRQNAEMKNEKTTQAHLANLAAICPQAIFGYSDELNKMFNKDFHGFLNLKYNQANNIVG